MLGIDWETGIFVVGWWGIEQLRDYIRGGWAWEINKPPKPII